MPIADDNDIRRRLRNSSVPPGRSNIISDIQPTQRRLFPNVGTTLPPRRLQSAPTRQPVSPRPAPATMPLPPRRPVIERPMPSSQPQPAEHPTNTLQQSLPPRQPLRPAVAPARPKRRRKIFTKKRLALVLVLLVLAAGSWVGVKAISNVQKVFHSSIFSVLTVTKLKGEDTGRVNILLAGNSADDPGHNGANLTDSIMVISIDVKNKSAFLLSVPRDLWVAIPGYGHAKINEVYVDGQAGNFDETGFPAGGMGLLEEVVQQDLGITPNYYALIDYNALRDGVNAVGGIDVNIQSEDPRGLYDPSIDYATHGPLVKLKNGIQHLNGAQALGLARARGDAYGAYGFPRSDFDRTEHQRLMMLALKSKVLSAGTLANPVALSDLFDTLGKNVHTDFSLSEVRRLYDIGKTIDNNSIQSVGLNDAGGVNLLSNYTSPNNQSALIPAAGLDNYTKIQAFITRLISDNAVVREGAKVVILNATNTSGLAAQKEKQLTGKEVNVTAIGDAKATATTTTTAIIDASDGSMPHTLSLLKFFYGQQVTTTNPYANSYDADFIVVIGDDQIPHPTTTTTTQ